MALEEIHEQIKQINPGSFQDFVARSGIDDRALALVEFSEQLTEFKIGIIALTAGQTVHLDTLISSTGRNDG